MRLVRSSGSQPGTQTRSAPSPDNLTEIEVPGDLAYGEAQKLALRFAVERGFDYVVHLPRTSRDVMEDIRPLIQVCLYSDPEVVVGYTTRSTAFDRFVRRIQTLLCGVGLPMTGFGPRVYSIRFLNEIDFELNTNRFHFDTEILLQALHSDAQIRWVCCAGHLVARRTRSRAWRDVLALALYRFHTCGILSSFKYRRKLGTRYTDKTGLAGSTHWHAVNAVKNRGMRRVLDLGCGRGHVAEKLIRAGVSVTGVDRDCLSPQLTEFVAADLSSEKLDVNPYQYDGVLLLDVIEHLSEPERFLLCLRNRYPCPEEREVPPVYLISTPNVAFLPIRIRLLFGRFNYGERGILDYDHRRLFTRGSFLRMLDDVGYAVTALHPVGPPVTLALNGWVGRTLERMGHVLSRVFPSLFAYQFFAVCTPKPSVSSLLKGYLDRGAPEMAHGGAEFEKCPDEFPAYIPHLGSVSVPSPPLAGED